MVVGDEQVGLTKSLHMLASHARVTLYMVTSYNRACDSPCGLFLMQKIITLELTLCSVKLERGTRALTWACGCPFVIMATALANS